MESPECRRRGTTTLFAAFDVATAEVSTDLHERHRTTEFIQFLRLIEETVDLALDIHGITDDHGTPKSPRTEAFLLRNPRFHMHFIPTHSWCLYPFPMARSAPPVSMKTSAPPAPP